MTWELIRHIEERPSGTTVEQVVTTIRSAIAERLGGTRHAPRASQRQARNNPPPHHTVRATNWALSAAGATGSLLGILKRSPQADDELTLRRHLKAARQLRTFCEAFISALEDKTRQ